MAAHQVIRKGGKRYILMEESEYRRLSRAASGAGAPALPEPDASGNRAAVPFARAVIARSLVEQRTRLGWTQAELARRSGVRVETLNRIERGHVTPDTATIAKLDILLRRGRRASKSPTPLTAHAAPGGARRTRAPRDSTGSAAKRR